MPLGYHEILTNDYLPVLIKHLVTTITSIVGFQRQRIRSSSSVIPQGLPCITEKSWLRSLISHTVNPWEAMFIWFKLVLYLITETNNIKWWYILHLWLPCHTGKLLVLKYLLNAVWIILEIFLKKIFSDISNKFGGKFKFIGDSKFLSQTSKSQTSMNMRFVSP